MAVLRDRCYVGFSPLAYLSTSPEGVIRKNGNKFELDSKKWRNVCYQVANTGANMMRLLPFGVWDCPSIEHVFTPYVYVGNGKWDLTQVNHDYFEILSRVVNIMDEYNLCLWFDLFDHCQNKTPGLSPHTCNVNGIHEIYDPKHDGLARDWIDRVFAILRNTSGVIYGCGNEMDGRGVGLCERVIYPKLVQLEIPVQFIAYGSCLELGEHHSLKVLDRMRKLAYNFWGEERRYILRPVHKILSTRQINATYPYGEYAYYGLLWWGQTPNNLRVAFSDDGTFDGTSECDVHRFERVPGQMEEQRRPSAQLWAEFCQFVMRTYSSTAHSFEKFVFEHTPKSKDIEGCQVATVSAMCEAYKSAYGVYPFNRNKYQKPIDKIPDDGETEEVKKEPINLWVFVFVAIVLGFFLLGLFCG